MDELAEFEQWRAGFRLSDDGLAAFRALKKLELISFEVQVKGDGWVDRVQRICEG